MKSQIALAVVAGCVAAVVSAQSPSSSFAHAKLQGGDGGDGSAVDQQGRVQISAADAKSLHDENLGGR